MIKFKGAPYVENFSTSNFCFKFYVEVVYPADHFFIFFQIFHVFEKHFLKLFIRTIKKPKIQFVRIKDG